MNPKVLKYFGTTNEQLRKFFTATPAGKDAEGKDVPADALYEKKVKFQQWIEGLVEDGRMHCYRTYRHYAAVDLMKDSQPILQENVPLMAYAQGKIDITVCQKELESLNCKDKFVETTTPAPTAEQTSVKPKTVVNLARLYEVCVNIGPSFIRRRVDAQMNKYNSLRPFFRFESRSTTLSAHLRGEVMSQYGEIMSDSYGYRHQHRQSVSDMLYYGHTVMFPAGAWDYDSQTEIAPENFDGKEVDFPADYQLEGEEKKPRLRTVITREGVKMLNIHPGRTFSDTAYPRATLNTDTGCRFAGFWDVKRFGDIANNPDFFNTHAVVWNTNGRSVMDKNRAYFDIVFAGQPLNFPGSPAKEEAANGVVDKAAENERTANAYLYAQTDSERSVFVTDLRVKVIPKEWGMGSYPQPVWLRVLIAGDNTVIFAEWMPSLPAVVWSHNEDDLRLVSNGQAHEVMPWQDQLSNIFSQLLLKMKHSLLRIIAINTDVVPGPVAAKFREALDSPKYYINPHLLEVSFKELRSDLGLDLAKVVQVIGTATSAREDSEFINNAFKAIVQILGIMERLLNLSPQEQGQPMPRESTAEEIAALESSTQVTYNAIGQSIDEARGAWKRIMFESSQAFASREVYLPVSQRFSKETIEKAGFKVVDEDAEEASGTAARSGRTVVGSYTHMVSDYVWTSRDGGDRFSNRESANTLVSLLGQVLPLIGIETLGKRRVFEIVNEIFRLLARYDLKLELNEGESDTAVAPETDAKFQELRQVVQEISGAVQKQEGDSEGLADAVEKVGTIVKELAAKVQAMEAASMQPAAA